MKILIVTKNWLGDTLFQIPAIETIKANYPDAEIVCLAPERCREMLESHPAVSRLIVLDEKKEHRSFLAKLGLIARLRREKWDKAYLFHRSRTRAFITLLAGAGERIGYGTHRRRLLTHPVEEPDTPMHQVDYFLELLSRAGLKRPENSAYRFYLSQKNREEAKRLLTSHGLIQEGILRPFVCFHLGANWAPKRWPVSHFARLADLIADKWNLPVVLTGSSDDLPLAGTVAKLVVHACVISLVGKTSLGELGAIYEKAGFVVSGDSGPMHIASGVGTPVAAIFGPTDPALTGPRGTGEKVILSFIPPGFKRPWYGPLPVEGWLSRLPAEEVFAAIEGKEWVLPTLSVLLPPTVAHLRGVQTVETHNLLITLSNIGDVILTTPVIMALVSQFPGSKLTVVAGPRAQGLLAGSRFIDRLVIYDKYAKFSEQWRLIRDLRRESYDWVVDLRNTAIPYLVKARKRSPFLFRPHKQSMRERHLEVVKRMGLSTAATATFDFFNAQDEASALQKLRAKGIVPEKKWILVSPVAASGLKTWRLAGFREVLERIVAERSEDILIVGDSREREIAQPLVAIDPSRIFNLAGETTLPELAALVSRCSLLLSNDSAVMHLGHELNRPVVAIFGPTHHEKYGRVGPNFRVVREPVFCAPCEQSRCRFERQACFEDLKADKVGQACLELLKSQPSLSTTTASQNGFPKRILVTRTDRIGDLVLSTPVFSSLRQKFPDARIACLTFLENREIVAGNPFIDEVILYDKKGSEKGFFGNLRFARGLAAKKFDIVIHLHATNRMHLAGWLARIPIRVGWDRKCGWALTRAYPDLKKEGKKHEAQYNFDLLKLLEVPSPVKLETYFPLKEKARQSLTELLRHHSIPTDRPWVILNPSASCPSKIWPAERFGQLADRIAEKYEAVFIAIGSRNDRPLVQKAREAAATPIYDLSGKLSLAMLGVLLKDAALLISNDSGPVHIASAVGTPVISIFGRKQPGLSPARWRPLGKNSKVIWKDVGCVECLAHRCQIHFLCLDAISVEDVLKETDSFGDRLKMEKIQKEKVLAP